MLVSARRDQDTARRFFCSALSHTQVIPTEVITDRAKVYPRVIDELVPATCHVTDRYANNRIEADHGRLKARLRPMRGVKQDRSLRVLVVTHAFIQNVRRGHYELATEVPLHLRLATAFEELALAL